MCKFALVLKYNVHLYLLDFSTLFQKECITKTGSRRQGLSCASLKSISLGKASLTYKFIF